MNAATSTMFQTSTGATTNGCNFGTGATGSLCFNYDLMPLLHTGETQTTVANGKCAYVRIFVISLSRSKQLNY